MKSISNKNQLVYIHIPKTAGISFRRQIVHHYRIIGVHPDGEVDDYYGFFQARLAELRTSLKTTPRYMLSGHFRYRELLASLGALLPDLTLMTHLRDPVTRTLSDYFYSISEAHPQHATVLERYPTFEHYMATPGQMNKQLAYLKPDEDATVSETIETMEREFAYVGLTETFAICQAYLYGALACPVPRELRENQNLNKDRMEHALEQFGPQLRQILNDEIKLYTHFRGKWTAEPEEPSA
ncbi:MAG: hypothetical protein AAGF81_06655 [Pseudomonadota bacterium]